MCCICARTQHCFFPLYEVLGGGGVPEPQDPPPPGSGPVLPTLGSTLLPHTYPSTNNPLAGRGVPYLMLDSWTHGDLQIASKLNWILVKLTQIWLGANKWNLQGINGVQWASVTPDWSPGWTVIFPAGPGRPAGLIGFIVRYALCLTYPFL